MHDCEMSHKEHLQAEYIVKLYGYNGWRSKKTVAIKIIRFKW
jgi:hypothetical protein